MHPYITESACFQSTYFCISLRFSGYILTNVNCFTIPFTVFFSWSRWWLSVVVTLKLSFNHDQLFCISHNQHCVILSYVLLGQTLSTKYLRCRDTDIQLMDHRLLKEKRPYVAHSIHNFNTDVIMMYLKCIYRCINVLINPYKRHS